MNDPIFMTKEELEAENAKLRAFNAKLLAALDHIKEYSLDPWAKNIAEAAIAKAEDRE